VIAKRPPLSDFALSPTRIFKIDEALERIHAAWSGFCLAVFSVNQNPFPAGTLESNLL